jgi:signal peptidase I
MSPRNPKIALALSLLMPGLGQVYNGELTKGLSLFLIVAFSIPVGAWIGINAGSLLWVMVLVGSLVTLAVYLFCAVDAYITAKRIGDTYVLGPYNRSYTYLALLFFGYFFVLLQLKDYTTTHLTEFYKIPAGSMIPNVLPGDHLFADKRVNAPGSVRKIKHGDVAIFIYPNDRNSIYVKRIIGLPGDTVEIAGSRVSVNGKLITRSAATDLGNAELNSMLTDHAAFLEAAESGATYPVVWRKDTPQSSVSVTVPDGYVYVLGDNRDNSVDSRKFGPVPLVDVVGVAKQVMFSSSQQAGLRMSRVGKNLQVN